MTITQTIEIPADRRITFNLPSEATAGTTARFELTWFSPKKEIKNIKTTVKEIQELCKNIPLSADDIREERRCDLDMEEEKWRKFTAGLGDAN